MKSKKISFVIVVGALVTAFGSTAFAQDMYGTFTDETGNSGQDQIKSTKTRAQVMAELEQARAQGWDPANQISGDPSSQTWSSPGSVAKSTRSREEVRAEAQQAAKGKTSNPVYESVGP